MEHMPDLSNQAHLEKFEKKNLNFFHSYFKVVQKVSEFVCGRHDFKYFHLKNRHSRAESPQNVILFRKC